MAHSCQIHRPPIRHCTAIDRDNEYSWNTIRAIWLSVKLRFARILTTQLSPAHVLQESHQ
jgi:hypothetical protein